MPLTAAGLTVPTGNQILQSMIDDYEALTGLTLDTTRTDDQVVMVLMAIATERIASAYELLQATYDGTNAEAALGIQLENAAYLVGVDPDPATYSQVTLTISGTNGTVIPEGSIVEGGGDDDDARWATSEPVTISGGTASVVAVAQIAGPTAATSGQVDKIVTAVPGWDSVTNSDAATPGEYRESDADLRRRRRQSLAISSSTSRASILSTILSFDYVQEATVIENADNNTQVVSGKTMDPNSIWVFLNPNVLTDAQKDELALALHRKVAAGTEMMVDTGSAHDTLEVTDRGRSTGREISWNYGTALDVEIGVVVDLAPGYTLADVTPGIQAAVFDHVNNALGMGDTLTDFNLQKAIFQQGVEGVEELSFGVTAIGGPPVYLLPYTPDIDRFWQVTVADISVTL